MSERRGNRDKDAFGDSLAAVRAALAQLREVAAANADDDQAFRDASQLVEAISGERGLAAEVRARIALRIWRKDGLSLSALAQRLGISKQRADQLVRKAREIER